MRQKAFRLFHAYGSQIFGKRTACLFVEQGAAVVRIEMKLIRKLPEHQFFPEMGVHKGQHFLEYRIFRKRDFFLFLFLFLCFLQYAVQLIQQKGELVPGDGLQTILM